MKPLRILDSGAYSAWSRGVKIDIDAYIAFALEHRHNFDVVINLDVIPSSKGIPPTSKQVEDSARKSWEAFLYMASKGVPTMPVFHQGERPYWLNKMVDFGLTYIGISPANDKTPGQRKVWLDDIFGRIVDKDGWPIIQTHGFGITSVPLLFRYPWYSVDSVSWLLFGAYGQILCPMPNRSLTGPDWTKSPLVVKVSSRGTLRGEAISSDTKIFDQMHRRQQEWVMRWIELCGSTLAEARKDWAERAYINGKFFLAVEEAWEPKPFIKSHGIF
jgi:hypothetical protein